MKESLESNTNNIFIISKQNIIVEVNLDFLKLTGYEYEELVGKTIIDVSKLLRLDSQINLEDLEEDASVFLFTKSLFAIEGIISCKNNDNGTQRVFSFNINPIDIVNEKFNLSNLFAEIRGEAVAICSFPSLTLINCNQNFLNLITFPFNEKSNSIGKNIMDLCTGDLDAKFQVIKDHVIKTAIPYHIEEIGIYSKVIGDAYWSITIVPILVHNVIKCFIISVANVTERVVNRKAIEQKNEVLEAVIDSMNDEIVIFDKDFDIIHSNKEVDKKVLFDNSSEKNFAKIMKDFVAFDKENKLIKNGDLPFQRVANGEPVKGYEFKTIISGSAIYRETYGSPIFDMEGNFSAGVMVYRDIEDRLQSEEDRLIKTQKELLSKVVEALDLELIRCTYPDLGIISINGNGFRSLVEKNSGIKSENYPLGENYFTIYPINEEAKRKELDLYLIEKKYYSYVDYASHIVDGTERFFKTINQPIFGLNKKIVEIIFITTDITDEVKAKNRMEETLEQQNQIFANISHELKTPLSVIFSASQLIELYLKKQVNNTDIENISEGIRVIKQNCFRFTKLINNIIDLSIMESGFYKLHFSNRNIIEVVENIVDSVKCYVEEKGLNIVFNSEIKEKIMAVDLDKKERIMLNLISNAIKFSPKGGTIYIEIKDKNEFIDILVRDEGMGIDKIYLKTIFDKYQKLDNSLNRNAEGTGIGLALVKKMVELVGGKISVESELGKGSLFIVSIPAKVLDETEPIESIYNFDNRIGQINIEFSDVYPR